MLELNIAMVVGWIACMFCVGYCLAWVTDTWRTERRKKRTKLNAAPIPVGMSLGNSPEIEHNTTPKIRLGVIEAMNGRILEVATATPIMGHSHYDWKTEMYVVPEGQKLSEAIATLMLMKGLEQ